MEKGEEEGEQKNGRKKRGWDGNKFKNRLLEDGGGVVSC